MKAIQSRRFQLVLLYLFFQTLFLIGIQFPRNYNFDEYHFVPQAQSMFASEGEVVPLEHPPLGMYLIRLGIQLDQNRPFGWRWMSSVFGALTLLWIYGIGWTLFRSHSAGFIAALLTGFNGVHFVASRIAMLEIYSLFFVLGALFWFLLTYDPEVSPRDTRTAWRLSGLFFGLSIGVKWISLLPLITLWLFFGLFFLMRYWKVSWPGIHPSSFFHYRLFRGQKPLDAILAFGVIPLLVYVTVWVPLFSSTLSFDDWIRFHSSHIKSLQLPNLHTYASPWWEWPLMLRPTWFAFDREGDGGQWFRGVLFLGNPLIVWGGLLSIVTCAVIWVREKSRNTFVVLFLFLGSYLGWAWVPRHPGFFYYYFLATPFLSYAIVLTLRRLTLGRRIERAAQWGIVGLAVIAFAFFYPILSATRVPMDLRPLWLWFETWI